MFLLCWFTWIGVEGKGFHKERCPLVIILLLLCIPCLPPIPQVAGISYLLTRMEAKTSDPNRLKEIRRWDIVVVWIHVCLVASIGGRQPHKNGNRMETKYRSGVTPHTRNTGVLSQYKRIASLPLSLLVKDSHHPPVQNESPSCFPSRHSGTCCSVYV